MRAKHLAIVRAALTFWDEEMSSASEAVYQHYLHSKDQGTLLTPPDVAEARCFFNEVDLQFALLESESSELVAAKLVDRPSELNCLPNQQIVSVLFR